MISLKSKLRGVYLKFYFYFKKKILYKDRFGLSYYLYQNTRPNNTFNIGVRSDDTTVLFIIYKILSSSTLTDKNFVNCIDVGGYIGVVTLMMSKALKDHKKNWKIHTFEPFEESFLRLQENVNLDLFKNKIILNKLAVSFKPGISTLKTFQNTPGENYLKIDDLSIKEDNSQQKTVKVITLRDYIYENNINHITICKIDTEGEDYNVIKGLKEYLEKKVIDYFIIEYQSVNFSKIQDILYNHGYTIYFMVRNKNILVSSLKNYPKNCRSLLNFVAVSQEKKIEFLKKFKIR